MTKKLMPPERAAKLLRLVVHFSVRMLARFLDPWSRAGADVLIEYVDSMWDPSPRKSRKVPGSSKNGHISPSDEHSGKETRNENPL